MTPVFGTARTYTQAIPPLPLDRCYGVVSFKTGRGGTDFQKTRCTAPFYRYRRYFGRKWICRPGL